MSILELERNVDTFKLGELILKLELELNVNIFELGALMLKLKLELLIVGVFMLT